MTDKLLTDRERKIRDRDLQICREFRSLRKKNPEASRARLAGAVAKLYGMTYQGVRNILLKNGAYPHSSASANQ